MRKLFEEFIIDLRGMKHYLIAAVVVFLAGIFLGLTATDALRQFIQEKIAGVAELASRLSEQDTPQLWFFGYIFLNNSIQSILIIFFGVLFALYPLFALVVNGMMLGYLFGRIPDAHEAWILAAKGILPHGIIEIPAILLASAYGIRLGALMFKAVLRLPLRMMRNQPARGGEWAHFFKMTLPLMLTLVSALFLAAAIESTLTYWLMKQG